MSTREPKSGERLAILSGVRTPFVKSGTLLKSAQADDLAVRVMTEAIAASGVDPGLLDEVIMGCVGQPWTAMNVARVAALRAGIPQHVPAVSVHRNCASSMEAITYAYDRMNAGRGELFLVGGTESMSQAPLVFSERMSLLFERLSRAKGPLDVARNLMGFRPRDLKPRLPLVEGLTDKTCGLIMGLTAENIVEDFSISREEQDAFALESHRRAAKARETGFFAEEVVPIPVPPKLDTVCEQDNGIRADQSLEALSRLKPYFDRKHGTVTVGNSCPVTDGAVALIASSQSKARELGVEPLGFVSTYAYAGLDPSRMGLGPVYAMERIARLTGYHPKDFDRIEINEAFAAQVIGCMRAAASREFCLENFGRDEPLGNIDPTRLNVHGGAIALGHPVGASGGRLVLTLLNELRREKLTRGLATLCVGGGLGAALVLETQ